MLGVSSIIKSQIGGQALFMMGAHNFVYGEYSLQFDIGHNAGGFTRIRVYLRPDDLYNIECLRMRKVNLIPTCVKFAGFKGIMASMLRAILSSATGMALSLNRHYADFNEYEPDSTEIPEAYK